MAKYSPCLRHPKNCRYVLGNKKCRFDEVCAFEHNLPNIAYSHEEADTTVTDLEEVIKRQAKEIEYLKNEVEKLKTHGATPEQQAEVEVEQEICEQHEIHFVCDLCEFTTSKKSGSRIHNSKLHKDLRVKESRSKVQKIENMEYEYFYVDETGGDCLKIFKVTKEIK